MSTGFIGAIEDILVGRLIAGILIAILRRPAGADDFAAEPFLLPALAAAAGEVFFVLAALSNAFLSLTFLLAPLVDVLVTVFFLESPLVARFTTFALESDFFGAFFLLTFFGAAFLLNEDLVFPVDFLDAFVVTRDFGAAFLALAAPLAEAFLWLRLAADLLAVFFLAVMRLYLLLPGRRAGCKMADYT